MNTPLPDMSESVQSDLLAAVRMTSVSGNQIVVDGLPVGVPAASAAELQKQLPVFAAALYSRWFARWWPPAFTERPPEDKPGIVPLVRAAHRATERFSEGWVARAAMPGGAVVAARNGEELYFESADYENLTRLAAPVRPGDSLAVTMRRDSVDQSGWWLTWSSLGPAPESGMLRIYWNVEAHSSAPLVREITTVLEDAAVPYTMKCPSHPALFGRCDAVVLYVAIGVWTDVKTRLREVCQNMGMHLREPTPPLTLRLGRGVALARDPGNGRSFGETMSWVIAEGVLSILAAGTVSDTNALGAMAHHLVVAGINLQRPYLGNGADPEFAIGW